MSTTTSNNFFESLFNSAKTWLESFFSKAENAVAPIEKSIADFGNAVVNEYKALASNPTVELAADWFIKIAENIDPALTPLISGIELEFPKLVTVVTKGITEIEKPLNQQLGDGLTALSTVKGINGTLYANALGGISAAVQNYVITNNATTVGVVPASQLITAAQIVHQTAA